MKSDVCSAKCIMLFVLTRPLLHNAPRRSDTTVLPAAATSLAAHLFNSLKPVMPPKNAFRLLLREARKAGVTLSNAFAPTPTRKKPKRNVIKGVYKGNFVRKKVPLKPPPPPPATVPKLPPLGPQTMPQPLKPVEKVTAGANKTTASKPLSRIHQWWRQNTAVLVLNFGSLCTLCGFTRSDVLELRAFSMTGSIASVAYFLLLPPPIKWAPVAWSSLFAAVNGVKIYKILYERNAEVVLTEREEEIFVEHFMPSGVTPKQFELVMKKATTMAFKKGDLIVQQGDVLNELYLVVSGKTRAQYMGRRLTAVSSAPGHREKKVGGDAGAWIGEMTFLEQFGRKEMKQTTPDANKRLMGRAIYTITAASDCEVLVWSYEDIEELMKSSTDLRASMTRAMTAPIVGKVINFTVSMGNKKGAWATWLDDWKNSGGNTRVEVKQADENSEQEVEPVM